jgi:hypothetical protein
MNLASAALATFILNLPFGYIRQGYRKFSLKWFIAIHAPVPFVVAFRHLFDLGFALYTYPVMVEAFFLGQLAGKKYRIKLDSDKKEI